MDALIELFWKSSLILAAAGFGALLARRASAATRHLIWMAALAGTLALPLASALLPRMGVAALPAAEPFTSALLLPEPRAAQPAVETVRFGVVAAGERGAPLEAAPARLDWGHVVRLVWASVALALLLRIAAGDLQLRAIARKAQRAVSREWLELLDQCAQRLGVRRNVVLLESDEVEVPITWGALRPRIVVPRAAKEWSAAHKRAVLLHELAHVERHDALTQRIARVACALQWMNPLAWAAASAMRRERERACDDRVLGEGAVPTEYATSLLEVARSAGGAGGPALAMARRAQLEGRLLAVLDPAVDRRPLSRRRMVTGLCAAAVVVAPLAAVRAERAEAEAVLQAPRVVEDAARPMARAVAMKVAQATPPAPPAPPRPPAPPAPRGRGSTHLENNGGSSTWTSTWSDGARSVSVNARGEVRWNEDATDVAGLSPGGSFDLTVHDGGHHWHAEIVPGTDSLTRTLVVDGAPRAWDPALFAQALEDLDRHSGFAADSRFPRLYQRGGARAVLEYVASMDGDYARRRYLQLLVERDPLDEATALALFKAVSEMSGDYDRAEVLKAAASKARLDTDAKRQAFLGACDGIQGDYERGRVLQELIAQPRLSPELARGVLSAASKMGGDYEKAQALTGLAQRHPVDALDYLKAAGKVGGDYEHARVLKALLSSQKLAEAAQVEVIRQARHLGDYEAAEVLVGLTGSTRLTAEAQREYQAAAEHLGDYLRKRVLSAASR
jgi:beta-lactamase regulating signal transducer with metallopeptidase domain